MIGWLCLVPVHFKGWSIHVNNFYGGVFSLDCVTLLFEELNFYLNDELSRKLNKVILLLLKQTK